MSVKNNQIKPVKNCYQYYKLLEWIKDNKFWTNIDFSDLSFNH